MENQNQNNNLLEAINTVVKRKTYHNVKEAIDAFKRAQIVPTGQVQLRSTILTGDYPGKQVNKPLLQQRPKRLVDLLGVKYISELSANFSYPAINENNSQWVGETEDGDLSSINLLSFVLKPQRALSYIEMSNEAVLNPNTNVEGAVQEDLVASIWELVESTMFNDIYVEEGASTLSSFQDLVDLELEAGNMKINDPIYLVSPTAASKLRLLHNQNYPIYRDTTINGKPVVETPYLSGERVIYGDFSRLLLCNWGGIDITVDSITKAKDGIIRLISNSYWNWSKLDGDSFLFGTTETTESTGD